MTDDVATFRTTPVGYERWSSGFQGQPAQVYVHRLLAVAEYGFKAVRDNHVHHGKEGGRLPACEIPWANWPGNLDVLTASEHMRHHNPEIPTGDLLAEVCRVAEVVDHTPSRPEFDRHGSYSLTPYLSRFDSWADVVEAAGVTPELTPGDTRGRELPAPCGVNGERGVSL